ncbi:DNA helicase UvrB [Enterococcus faecalis]|uniref:DNA helicase UvrB n=1 Tax=Enterococcus faecalis TaxID=1351 RepID=UPI002DBB10A0|nr:DNA helicase UvrB [Enterococcus faecalis]MEB7776324.1 DNA helicase UvrB [Enterococcus faecalis]
MNFGYLNFGTKDAILGIAFFLILILTVSFHWSALEFVLSSGVVGMAFFAGNMKQDVNLKDSIKFVE